MKLHATTCGTVISLIAMPASMAAVLAGWETWTAGGIGATTVATGVTAFSTEGAGDWRENNQAASNDGAYGNILAAAGPSDHDDFDLTGLADNVLLPGESTTICISFSGGTASSTYQITYLDNVAITGVPEPSAALPGELGALVV